MRKGTGCRPKMVGWGQEFRAGENSPARYPCRHRKGNGVKAQRCTDRNFAAMAYRKLGAEKIFDGYRFWKNHVLVLDAGGRVEALLPAAVASQGVEWMEGILCPGLVNCHCHLELSHMKGVIPERTGLVDFVFNVVSGRSAPETEILAAIAGAEAAMQQAGIVAVGDICNNTLTLPQKQKGHLQYYNFIETSGWLPSLAEPRFNRALAVYEAFETLLAGSRQPVCAAMVPHAPYSVSEALWRAIQPYFSNKVVSIHNQETRFEDEFFLQGTGDFQRMYALMQLDNSHHRPTMRSSLQSYFHQLRGAKNIVLVHNTFTNEDDIDFVQAPWPSATNAGSASASTGPHPPPQTFFCLCVNANLYIEDALPPVALFRQKGCQIVLGTDSLASNGSLSILDEIKTLRKHFPQLPLEEMLGWATLNGARALAMDHSLGSFEKGKTPGVVLLNEDSLAVRRVF